MKKTKGQRSNSELLTKNHKTKVPISIDIVVIRKEVSIINLLTFIQAIKSRML